MVATKNCIVTEHDRKLTKSRSREFEAFKLKKSLNMERTSSDLLAQEVDSLKLEMLQLQEDLARKERELSEAIAGKENIVAERDGLRMRYHSEVARLRRSRLECMQRERKFLKKGLVAKYEARFAKVRQYISKVSASNDMALMLSQIIGTIGCLKVMKDKKRIDVPPK